MKTLKRLSKTFSINFH